MYSSAHGEILNFFYSKTGIHFDEKKDVVAHKIDTFYKSKDFHDISTFLAEIKKEGILWQEFVNLLTVNETYFFRETKQIDIMVEMARQRGNFNILCAPSSSGEEPYTILMSLAEAGLLSKLGKLVGIDINSFVIESAKKGVYSKRSLHRTPIEAASKYFRENDERYYEIVAEIKRSADFRVFNIFDPHIKSLGEFDFVFSRNMIIYFDKESRMQAEKTLHSLMKPGGVLFLGHADLIPNNVGFKKVVQNGIVYYQKQ